jgi:hypothetical protein
MFIGGLFFAFLLAIVFTLVFASRFRGQGWGLGMIFFFLILFLATWAGGLWLTPIGPLWWGVPWFSFLLVSVVVGLLLAVMTPDRRRPPGSANARRRVQSEADTIVAIDIFFWLLLAGLLVAIAVHYAVAV